MTDTPQAGAGAARAIGAGAGVVVSVMVVWAGVTLVELPVYSLLPSLAFAFLAPGLVLAAMIGWQAAARFSDPAHPASAPLPGSRREIDAHVLRETVALMVMALALWPPLAYLLVGDGPGVVVALGLALALARLAGWVGCHFSASLRAFGFAASYFPTVAAALWAGAGWLMRLSG
ncbi:MAG: MAPEG family protein [Alphaproteobacteria bacterium]|nr:MAG: MAPEG family protein [Alphaproteobacteria bacterium]